MYMWKPNVNSRRKKNTISDIENLIPVFNSRKDTAEERITELKHEKKFAKMECGTEKCVR